MRRPQEPVQAGYFICATDERAYLAEGRKLRNAHYRTHHGATYAPSHILAAGAPPNGIGRPLVFPAHEVVFRWEDTAGRFAWLAPIRVRG